ncbi:STAS domain-containing protein [Mycolicibacterium cosmeticum]|uniref:STAS domain-containing protein n=1 Tax=Mycolicibacterium cosmeticum TaxID=258533 RepID=UPI00320462EB
MPDPTSDHFERSPSPFMCAQTWHDTTVVIGCSGVVDMLTVPDFNQVIATALEKQPTAMIIDLTEISFFASCGMATLVDTQNQVPADVPLIVVADGPVTRRPLELVGLAAVLTIRPTLDDAFEQLPAGQA